MNKAETRPTAAAETPKSWGREKDSRVGLEMGLTINYSRLTYIP